MRIQPTIKLNLSNFRAYAGRDELKKYRTTLETQPPSKEETKRFKRLKSAMRLIRQDYFQDTERIGIQVLYIHPETYNSLKDVILFLHGNKNEEKVKIKYRKVLIAPGEGVKHGEVHGEG